MVCYHPLRAWRTATRGASGKLGITFAPNKGYQDKPLQLPCGQCIGCRLERSRQWAMRCVHEAAMHEDNCFVTLTYDDEHLPADRSLHYRDFQLFNYRLRKRFGAGVRFYMCGEYGETYGRPHYHACFFNLDFGDLEPFKGSGKSQLFVSSELSRLWTSGYSTVGRVTFDSAAYVARYVMKKVTGAAAAAHYEWIDHETGEVFDRVSEFTRMSLKPGIGRLWYEKYHNEVYPDDFVVMNGKKVRPPKYYDQLYELTYPSDFRSIRFSRKSVGRKHADDATKERLAVREKVAKAKLSRFKRNVE